MNFSSPIDQNQIIFSHIDGKPLTNGKLYFYALGTSTAKGVFLDEARTTPAGSMIRLDIIGRPEFQTYLDYGDYWVEAFRFIGTDPYSVDPNDWALDHNWSQSGLQAPASQGNALLNVDTITALRGVTGMVAGDMLQVLGYYAKGDMFPRTYKWNASSLTADNSGTMIRNPTVAIGAWELAVEGDVIDSRIFGVLPSLAIDLTTTIANYVSIVQSLTGVPKQLFFVSGIYKVSAYNQYVTSPLKLDKQVVFQCTSAGKYAMVVNGSFTCDKTEDFNSPLSTGYAVLEFNSSEFPVDVDVRWYGAKVDGSTDDGTAFDRCVDSVLVAGHNIKIVGALRLATMPSDLTIYNDLLFVDYGQIKMDQITYTLTLSAPCKIINNTSGGLKRHQAVFSNTAGIVDNAGRYAFSGVDLRSSFFVNSSDIATALQNPIGSFTVTPGTRFIFDALVNIFTDSIDTTTASLYTFVWERGEISASSGKIIRLCNFVAPDTFIFTSAGFYLHNVTTRYSWFCTEGASTSDMTNAFNRAVQSATAGGVLDLCNRSITVDSGAGIYNDCPRLVVQNGSISSACAVLGLVTVVGVSIGNLAVNNITVNSTTNGDIIHLNGDSVCRDIRINACNITSTNSGASLVGVSSASIVSRAIYVESSYINTGDFIANGGSIEALVCSNNKITLDIGSNIKGIKAMLTNNNFYGVGALYVTGAEGTIVNGNTFSELSLYIYSESAVITGVFNGNTFISTNTNVSDIHILASETDTLVKGLSIVGNTFNGTQATATAVISSYGTFAIGTVSVSPRHQMTISNNSANRIGNLYAPSTEGSDYITAYLDSGTGIGKIFYRSVVSNSLIMFTLDGVYQPPRCLTGALTYLSTYAGYISLAYVAGDVDTSGGLGTVIYYNVLGATYTGDVGFNATWKFY